MLKALSIKERLYLKILSAKFYGTTTY